MESHVLTALQRILRSPYESLSNLAFKVTNETWMNFHKINICYLLSSRWFPMTVNIRTRLLCCWNDARCYESIRYGSVWNRYASLTSPLWYDHGCRYTYKQNGTHPTSTIRTNAWTPMNSFYGKLRKRWWLLSLLVCCRPGLWSNHARRHLCSRMSAYRRSFTFRFNPASR